MADPPSSLEQSMLLDRPDVLTGDKAPLPNDVLGAVAAAAAGDDSADVMPTGTSRLLD